MSELLQFLLSGVTVGAVYALVALGFTIIYNASDVVNFAQGEFVMLGGMISVAGVATGLPLTLLTSLVLPGAVPFRTDVTIDAAVTCAFMVFSLLGGLISVRVVSRIDPVEAIA